MHYPVEDQLSLICIDSRILPCLSTSTIPRLFLIHLNQDLMVLALLSRVDPVKSDFFFNKSIICCFVMDLSRSLDMSKNISFIMGNSRSNLQIKLDLFSVDNLKYCSPLSV